MTQVGSNGQSKALWNTETFKATVPELYRDFGTTWNASPQWHLLDTFAIVTSRWHCETMDADKPCKILNEIFFFFF